MTYDNIMQSMLDSVSDDMDKREGSVIWDALSPAARELELAYMALEYALLEGFADTCDREYLVRRAQERGIIVKEASPATIKAVFTPATLDLAGERFTLNMLDYTVTDPIDGEAGAWKLVCETPGSEGNSIVGDLIPIDDIDELESAEATELLIPGEDAEDTEVLRQRYFNSFEATAYGGNIQDYLDKTNSLNGVGATKVIPVWNGGGTVKLIILDSSFGKASSVLIDAVQTAIDPIPNQGQGVGIAPIGHTVTVVTATEVPVHILTTLEFETGYSWDSLQAVIEAKVEEYLLSLRREWQDEESLIVRISQLETRLLSITGILDVTQTTINGEAQNLTLDGDEIPVFGSVGDGTA